MSGGKSQVAKAFHAGIVACREKRWREGYGQLAEVARVAGSGKQLPSVFYSYLGLSMAHCEGRKREGLQLCRYAVRLEPRRPENQLNLAIAYRMVRRRRAAVRALQAGLALSPNHARLRELEAELGVRRPPVLPFLGRDNALNRTLGLARARYAEWRQQKREERLEEEALGLLD